MVQDPPCWKRRVCTGGKTPTTPDREYLHQWRSAGSTWGELAGVFVGEGVGHADDVLLALDGGLQTSHGVHAAVGYRAALCSGVDALLRVGGDGVVWLAFIKAGVVL